MCATSGCQPAPRDSLGRDGSGRERGQQEDLEPWKERTGPETGLCWLAGALPQAQHLSAPVSVRCHRKEMWSPCFCSFTLQSSRDGVFTPLVLTMVLKTTCLP